MRTAASLLSAPAAAGQPLAIHFVGRQGRAAATAAQNAAGEKLKVNPLSTQYKNPNLQNRYVKGELIALQKDSLLYKRIHLWVPLNSQLLKNSQEELS